VRRVRACAWRWGGCIIRPACRRLFVLVCLFVDQQFNQTSYIGSLVTLSWCLYCMYNFAEADTWSVCRDRVVNDCGKIIFILLSFSGSLAPGYWTAWPTINKSVFSYLRTLKTWHCPHLQLSVVLRPRASAAPAVLQSIDRVYLQRAYGTDGHRTVSYADSANKKRGHF